MGMHPCFSEEGRAKAARIHLPVASRCNLQCRYCDRDFDCANESRPGVSAALLSPAEAVDYTKRMIDTRPEISVVGIAGPGDPFANPMETLETLTGIRRAFPDIILCLATNGLALPPFLSEVAALRVSHVTVTVNAVDAWVGKNIYSWVRDGKRAYQGLEGAALLWERQREAIIGLKARGVTVKVNTVVIPGVNDFHVAETARTVKWLGADIQNLIPLYPVKGTPFGQVAEPGKALMASLRFQAGTFIEQMSHCARCRADAVGFLGEVNRPEEAASAGTVMVAVASQEGVFINMHLGEAERLEIFRCGPEGVERLESRAVPAPGGGTGRWEALAEIISDCSLLLVSGAGESPKRVLSERGIEVRELEGLIQDALAAISAGKDLKPMARKAAFACGASCSGNGGGCG